MGAVLLINSSGVETRVALVEDGTISEFYLERKKDKGIVGNIYKGKVVRVLPGMQAAFVDIGLDKAAFLYVNDVFYDPDFSEQQFELTEGEHADYDDEVPSETTPVHGRGHKHCRGDRCECKDDAHDEEGLTIVTSNLSSNEGASDVSEDEATPANESGADDEERHGEIRSKHGRRRNRGAHREARIASDAASDAQTSEVAPQEEVASDVANASTAEAVVADKAPDAELITPVVGELAPEGDVASVVAPASEDVADKPAETAPVETVACAVEAKEESASDVVEEKSSDSNDLAPKAEAEVEAKEAKVEVDEAAEAPVVAPQTEDVAEEGVTATVAEEEKPAIETAKAEAPAETESVTPVEEATPSVEKTPAQENHGHKGNNGNDRRGNRNSDRGEKGERSEKGDRGRKNGKGERDEEPKRRPTADIQDLLKVGQEIIVQVAKDPIGTKGARVTSHISIPGRQIVFMPTVDHVGISRRIEKESERRRLRDIVEHLRPAGTGFIVRTVAENISTEKLEADAKFLIGIWSEVVVKKDKVSAPALLHPDLDLTLRATRDLFVQDVERLVIDDRAEWERISRFVASQAPALKERVVLHDSDEPIFEAYGIEDELKRAYSRKVWLKSGGYLIIDQAEALTAIDVNSGRYVGTKNLEETITKINIEAAKEIVYQLRLRNIGGIMIIDFIDMSKAQNRDKVFRALQEALGKDKARTNILKISELGLIEMTRKRVRESVGRTLNEPCPYCDGRGFLKSRETVAYEIFRQIRSTAYLYTDCSINVNCHPDVARILTVDERSELRYLMNRFNKTIHVHPQPGYHQEQVEIYGKQERQSRKNNVHDQNHNRGGQLKTPSASGEMRPAMTLLETPQGKLSEYGSDGKPNNN